MSIFIFVVLAGFYLAVINTMTNSLVVQKEMEEEKIPNVFTTINVLIMILLASTYVRLLVIHDF
ncbi:hypothetical protein [Natribacillus halophilus]|uniref:Uncharacterized protein n=1 Tax=Natribacillus halophilus TaxID=549003 RepID=A0A1G8NWI2_9BACI|nr:hypothetical protein [Natribacillus halophilus]SDI84544.1 hypothetical protein SAMN04488123_10768 [Natribacillus halophilus]